MGSEELEREMRICGFMLRLAKDPRFVVEEKRNRASLKSTIPSKVRLDKTSWRIKIKDDMRLFAKEEHLPYLVMTHFSGNVNLDECLDQMPEELQELVLFNINLFEG